MVTDIISNLIIAIKNGNAAGKATVSVPYSALKESIVVALKKAGFIASYEKKGMKATKTLVIELIYQGRIPRVQGTERVSKPSRRLYHQAKDIKPYRNGFGRIVYSTPKGVLLDEEAKRLNVGGEILFKIW